MTYAEKLKKEQPEKGEEFDLAGAYCSPCPGSYFPGAPCYNNDQCPGCSTTSCIKCWDQEAPEEAQTDGPFTEQLTEPTEKVNALKGKVVYIAGPITGVEKYWEAFELAEDTLTGLGCLVLNPAKHPKGMTNAQYMRLSFAMIDTADAVLFLPGWMDSKGATVEHAYCEYIGKPKVSATEHFAWPYGINADTMRAMLEEVLG